MLADGSIRNVRRGEDKDFWFYVMNFGALGVITKMSFKVYPEFHVYKSIYQNLPWDMLHNQE